MVRYTSTITPELAKWHQAAIAVIGDDDLGQAVAWACTCFDIIVPENIAADFDRHVLDALKVLHHLSEVGLLRFESAGTFCRNGVFVALSVHDDATVH
jgi:hypothetical protein